MTNFNKYLNFKLINSLINSDEISKMLDSYSDIINTEIFIENVNEFCVNYINTNRLYKEQVLRFEKIVEYIKKYNPSESFDNIIESINKTDYSNRSSYIVENYINRFKGHNFYKIYVSFGSMNELIKKVKNSVCKDYFFLRMLTDFSEEEFNFSLRFTTLDEYFLLSINQIIYEYPEILKNKTFVRRVKVVTGENINKIDDITNTKQKRIILKKSKYYNTHLKEE